MPFIIARGTTRYEVEGQTRTPRLSLVQMLVPVLSLLALWPKR